MQLDENCEHWQNRNAGFHMQTAALCIKPVPQALKALGALLPSSNFTIVSMTYNIHTTFIRHEANVRGLIHIRRCLILLYNSLCSGRSMSACSNYIPLSFAAGIQACAKERTASLCIDSCPKGFTAAMTRDVRWCNWQSCMCR